MSDFKQLWTLTGGVSLEFNNPKQSIESLQMGNCNNARWQLAFMSDYVNVNIEKDLTGLKE